MEPGERITLIKKIAGRLANSPLEETRLTLRQFGVGISWYQPDSDTIDPFQSVILAVEDEPDETLVRLHGYLFGEAPPTAIGAPSRTAAADVWPRDLFRLFISHTSAHKDEVGGLQMFLQPEGVYGFVAHADIEPSRAWQNVIESALDTCEALAAYMTPDFQQSLWTDQEVGFCVARSVLIIPIRVGLNPYGFIGKYQALQGEGKNPLQLASEITDILVAHPLTAPSMAAPTVQAFAASGSFDSARKNFARVRRIPASAWTPEMIEVAGRGIEENSQLVHGIYDKREIPKLMQDLLSRVRAENPDLR